MGKISISNDLPDFLNTEDDQRVLNPVHFDFLQRFGKFRIGDGVLLEDSLEIISNLHTGQEVGWMEISAHRQPALELLLKAPDMLHLLEIIQLWGPRILKGMPVVEQDIFGPVLHDVCTLLDHINKSR